MTVELAPRRRPSRAALLSILLLSVACQRSTGPAPLEPEPPPPELPSFSDLTADLTPLDLTPDPLPEGIAAAVDGEPIMEAEVEQIVEILGSAADSEPVDPHAVRVAALLQAVESRLLLAKADQLDVRIAEEELRTALEGVADAQGLTVDELEGEVSAEGGTWDEYRDSVIAQMVEMRVLQILGVYGPASRDDASIEARRTRVLGCMRARAEVQVRDDAFVLPDNPFVVVAKLGEIRFVGDPALPEEELRTAARKAATERMRLCDALTSAELAIQEIYLERGYLEADVQIPWPVETTSPVVVDVQVAAGRAHLIGKLGFDQSAVPTRKRLDEVELRKRLAGFVTPGDAATMSALQGASEEIGWAFGQAGLGTVEMVVERKERKKDVRMNITYRVVVGD